MEKVKVFNAVCLVILFVIVGFFLLICILNAQDSPQIPARRDAYIYDVMIEGLSGRVVEGTTTILVPIPATMDGEFAITPSQKELDFKTELLYKYIYRIPEHGIPQYMEDPYLLSTTEQLDNKFISNGEWITFIAQTEEGYMLGFESKDDILKDISFSVEVVVEDIDIFNPIDNSGPILYPVIDLPETELIPYGNQMKYNSPVNYATYVYLSDNIEDGKKSIHITMDAHNDLHEWPEEYRGHYTVKIWEDVDGAGKIKVKATLTQELLFPLMGE